MTADHAKTSVLVIDDDDSARRMMRRALERRGYGVLDAANGRAGVDVVHAQQPDLVLLDMRMPGELSGADVARELRAATDTIGRVPIIVVSASVHADARELMAALDCDGFVEKPVEFSELFATIERVLAGAS